MPGLHFESSIDFQQLDRQLKVIETKISGLARSTEKAGDDMDATFRRVGAAVGAYFSFQAMSGFAMEVANVRGEFQQLEVAFETMLGSKEKSDRLMAEVVELAAATPFSLTELGQGSKMLLAFKEPADQVANTLKRMGDLAAGASVPVGDLIRAYGKVSAKGKMQAEELNQFAERGIPIISELAKVVGRTDAEIYKMAEQGEIGFAELQQAIRNMTDEGGMFFNLMEKQSKTITGLISNLGDAWDRMMNQIGENNDGLISGSIEGLISLVENYEKVVDILKIAIATYGTYKAAVIMNVVHMKGLTGAIKSATIAQQLFNLASKANPVGLMMAGLTTIVGALYTYTRYTREAATATEEINQSITAETSKLNYLFEAIKRTGEGTEERKKLIGEVNEKYGNYLDNLLTEKSTLEDIEKAQRSATRALMADIAVKESKRKIEEELSDYTKKLERKFRDFSSVVSKMSPAVHAEFLRELNNAIEEQADASGKKTKESFQVAKELYDKYISEISRKTAYTKYDFGSFQNAFFDVAQVRKDKNKVINELNGYVDAYQQIFNKINEPATGGDPSESLRKDVEYWEKERKAAKEALDKLTKEDTDFRANQAKYLAQIEQAENEINQIRGKTEKDKQLSLTDSINEQIEAWERYYRYVEHGYQDLAQKQSDALKTTANTLRDYLLEVEGELMSQLSVLDPSSEAYRDAAEALVNVKAKRQEVEGGKTVLEQYRDSVEQQKAIFQEYEEWRSKFGTEKANERFGAELGVFDSYIDYLQAELKKLEGRTDPTGISQRAFIGGEISKTESDERKRTQQALEEVLMETRTHNERLLALQREYEQKLSLLEGDSNEERRAMLREIYEQKRQELEAAHFHEVESYKWVYENMDRMGRRALRAYIARLREELSHAKYQSAEMLQVRLQLEEKLAHAEQKLKDRLPDTLREVSGVMREAADLAGEFDQNLANALESASRIAEALANEVSGALRVMAGDLSGLTQMISGRLQLIKEVYRQLKPSSVDMEEIERQADEMVRRIQERLTGISFDGFVDEFMSALLAGERSAADFADNVEDMLRNAVIEGFKTKYLMDALEPWYRQFAFLSQDGLTPEEIELLRANLQGTFADVAEAFDMLQDLGIDFSGMKDSANSLSGAIKGITEDTASVLAGRLNAMHISVNEHIQVAQRAVLYQAQIASNTDRLLAIEGYLRDIKNGMGTSGTGTGKSRALGI